MLPPAKLNHHMVLSGTAGTGESMVIYIQAFNVLENSGWISPTKESELELMNLLGHPKIYFFTGGLTIERLEQIAYKLNKAHLIPLFANFVEVHRHISLSKVKGMRIMPNSLICLHEVHLGEDIKQTHKLCTYLSKEISCTLLATTQPKR